MMMMKWWRERKNRQLQERMRLELAVAGGSKLEPWEEELHARNLTRLERTSSWPMRELISAWAVWRAQPVRGAFGNVLLEAAQFGFSPTAVARDHARARARAEWPGGGA